MTKATANTGQTLAADALETRSYAGLNLSARSSSPFVPEWARHFDGMSSETLRQCLSL